MANVFVEENILQGWADTVREKTGTTDKMKPSVLLEQTQANWGTGGGGAVGDATVKYVTFKDEADTVLFQMPVLVGDDCKDPVSHGDISKPTKESTNTTNYTHSGWTSAVGGDADSNILKNITADKTVYVAFAASIRYYTVTFYDDTTVLKTVQATYGADVSDYTPMKSGYSFNGWEPSPTNVTADMDCYAIWWQSGFVSASWAEVIYACQNNSVPDDWSVGDSKEMVIGDKSYIIDIIGKNHDQYSDGSYAPLTFQLHNCLETTYQMNDVKTNSGGYDSMKMHTTHLPAIKKLMPTEVQAAIKPVRKKTTIGGGSTTTEQASCELFLLSQKEVLNTGANEGSQYAYYAEGNSSAKTDVNGNTAYWWLRSPYAISGVAAEFLFINASGDWFESDPTTKRQVSFGFCF